MLFSKEFFICCVFDKVFFFFNLAVSISLLFDIYNAYGLSYGCYIENIENSGKDYEIIRNIKWKWEWEGERK